MNDNCSIENNEDFHQKLKKKNKKKSKKLDKRKSCTPLYLKTPQAIVIFVKPNGLLSPEFRIVGFSLDEILINCTQVMKLSSSARKLYSNSGQLIYSFEQLTTHGEVYVSLGEPFLDPIKFIRESINIRAGSFWGLNGVYIPKTKCKAISAEPKFGQPNKLWRIFTFNNGEFRFNEAVEILSDLKDIEKLKEMCSLKLNFNGKCKRLFDHNYKEIFNLNELVNEESYVWNNINNIKILGPIWASKCEDLNEEAVYNYFLQMKNLIDSNYKDSKFHLKQLKIVENGDPDQIADSRIKAFSKQELKIRIEEAEKKFENLKNILEKFSNQISNLPEPTTQIITEPDKCMTKSTYLCAKGLRLMAYRNGLYPNQKFIIFFNIQQEKRGINDSKILFNRLLDNLSQNGHLSQINDFSRGILARRIFTETGEEIKDVLSLSYDQTICVSYGEDWIDPISICAFVEIQLMSRDLERKTFDFEFSTKDLKEFKSPKNIENHPKLLNLPLLQHQKKSNMFLTAFISVKDRKEKADNYSNNWLYTTTGRLILKKIPSLCLTLFNNHIETTEINKSSFKNPATEPEKDENISINYYPVQFSIIHAHDTNQMWHFNTSGFLYNKANPEYFLTYFDLQNKETKKDYEYIDQNSNVVAAEILPDELHVYQRWAFKQESFKNLNQWKLCDLPNPEWHKTALTWPLTAKGGLNVKLTWPIEGLLVPCVPSLTPRKYELETRFPKKLMVFKNNDHTMKEPVLVIGPDLTKLIKKGQKEPYETHCTNEFLLELEFQMFLENCTNILCLPSAARRIFDELGNEKSDLSDLSNNSIVYVSMGDMWCSPSKTLSLIELRVYANKLTVDIERLKYFIELEVPNEEFVIGIKDNILEENKILEIQYTNEETKSILQKIIDEDNCIPTPEPSKEPSIDESLKHKTFHEKCCEAASLRHKIKTTIETDSKEDSVQETIKKSFETVSHLNLQQFIFQNGLILVKNNPNYCVYPDDIGKPLSIKKLGTTLSSNRFKWILHKSGFIESVHYRGYVISIHCPKMLPFQDKAQGGYLYRTLVLEKAVNSKYGKAYQVFKIDPRSSLLYPFNTNSLDKSITAALLSSICTNFVCSKPISQPGSFLEINIEQKPSCQSCIGIMNGKYPITPFQTNFVKFLCCNLGGFKVLNKTIDLSPSKAMETCQYFINKLENIRRQLTVKICKSRFTSSLSKNIHVNLYLNNSIKYIPPQKVTGKSIVQIMEIATGIFNLQRPVRILYTKKGESIYDDLSFKNAICGANDVNLLTKKNESKEDSSPDNNISDTNNGNPDSNFNITLSKDERFFIIEFTNKQPSHLYNLQINTTSINGINIFHKLHKDSAFLFNYEIFNNQINTELFVGDSDFEGEQTEFAIKSSPSALRYLFSKIMTTLRLQLISARINNKLNSTNDLQVDIESIDAIADFSFTELVIKLEDDAFERYEMKLPIPLISTETFMPTKATLLVEITLVATLDITSKHIEETLSIETGSVINELTFIPSDNPIDLWASTGEPFNFRHEDSNKIKSKEKNHDLRKQLKFEIDKKKFLLRTVKGERLKKLNSGTLESTPSEKNPVKIKGNWQFPTIEEIQLVEEIQHLQKNLDDIKLTNVSQETKPYELSRNLYKQKHLKHCLVHLNGEKENTSVPVSGESLWEIFQNSAQILGLKKNPKYLFDRNGQEIISFANILPGEIFSVSHQQTYISPKNSELQCEIKANWGRARRQYGENSTDIKVKYRTNTVIDIDPFEPPDVMKSVKELPSKDPKNIKVFENGQSTSSAREITGHSLLELLRNATRILELNLPVKCFYTLDGKRITGFKEILHDDLLAASVSGKGILKIDDN